MLYRHIKLGNGSFTSFLVAGRPIHSRRIKKEKPWRSGEVEVVWAEGELGWRTRRAFAYVETLRLSTPLSETDFAMLWDAALPGTPLFPQVRSLQLEDNTSVEYGPHHGPSNAAFGLTAATPSTLSLFDRPHVCVTGGSAGHVLGLLTNARSFTFHGVSACDLFSRLKIPESWDSLRVFNAREYGGGFDYFANEVLPQTDLGIQTPETPIVYAHNRIPVYYLIHYEEEAGPDWDERPYLGLRDDSKRFPNTCSVFDLMLFSGDDKDDCPPCTECGEFWAVQKWNCSSLIAAGQRWVERE